MLVLTRKIGERVVIGNSIVVTVVQAGRGKVRLGIEAPPGVRVLREELRERDLALAAPQPAVAQT